MLFDRVMKKLPLYLLLAVPAAVGSIWVLGNEVGLVVALIANLALWHILLRPSSENGDDVQE